MTSSAEIYDAFAEHYRGYSEGKSAYIAGVDGLIKQVFTTPPQRLLDFGAGDGVRGAALKQELDAAYLLQVDVSDAMLTKCREIGQADELIDCKKQGWEKGLTPCDAVLCLWNVLGHIPTTEERIVALTQLRGLLAEGGRLCFDVNNRHNNAYGKWRVLGRRILDRIAPDYSRGDTQFDWEIDGVKYPAHGHLFTKAEVEYMLRAAGLEVQDCYAVHYQTGAVSRNLSDGQLFFVAQAR